MTTYDKFKKLDIDFSLLGLEQRKGDGRYFCTPKGAKIIGNEGVDGIHYCFVKGFDETVFAVNPSNPAANQVHPLAHNFDDFLRLISACGGTAAVEQAWMWNKSEFDAFVKENPPLAEQQAVFDVLKEKLSVTPMENPYEYIHSLQADFDYSQIPYTKEYSRLLAEVASPKPPEEWKVFFAEPFCLGSGRGKAVREIAVNKNFFRYGRTWHVPTVYVCGKGWVADLCVEVEPSAIADYEAGKTAEDPMSTNFETALTVNGRPLYAQTVNFSYWVPEACRPKGRAFPYRESEFIIDHYGLNPQKGWIFMRCSFAMQNAAKHVLKSLSLSLTARPVFVLGACFTVSGKGDTVAFTNPVTGSAHTLRVTDCENKEVAALRSAYYTELSYVIEPDLPSDSFVLEDAGGGDSAVKSVGGADFVGTATAVISSADGPTIMVASGKGGSNARTACSSLYRTVRKNTEWRMKFYKKPTEDIEVDLL